MGSCYSFFIFPLTGKSGFDLAKELPSVANSLAGVRFTSYFCFKNRTDIGVTNSISQSVPFFGFRRPGVAQIAQ